MTTLAQDLGGVVRLLEKATPGELTVTWMENASTRWPVATDSRRQLTVEAYSRRKDADTRAIAACVNFLRTHSAEIAGALRDAERYRWLRSDSADLGPLFSAGSGGSLEMHSGDDLDTAIDAAMQQGGGGGE